MKHDKLSKLDKIKIALNVMKKEHSHERENARRRKQISKGMIRATTIFLLFHACPAWPSETSIGAVPNATRPMLNDVSESVNLPVANVRVELEDLDHQESYTEIMPVGSTAADALSKHHRLTRGKICLDPEGVLAVDGVGDYANGDYWVVSVNGDYVHANAHTQLKSGDQVKWQHLKK